MDNALQDFNNIADSLNGNGFLGLLSELFSLLPTEFIIFISVACLVCFICGVVWLLVEVL